MRFGCENGCETTCDVQIERGIPTYRATPAPLQCVPELHLCDCTWQTFHARTLNAFVDMLNDVAHGTCARCKKMETGQRVGTGTCHIACW